MSDTREEGGRPPAETAPSEEDPVTGALPTSELGDMGGLLPLVLGESEAPAPSIPQDSQTLSASYSAPIFGHTVFDDLLFSPREGGHPQGGFLSLLGDFPTGEQPSTQYVHTLARTPSVTTIQGHLTGNGSQTTIAQGSESPLLFPSFSSPEPQPGSYGFSDSAHTGIGLDIDDIVSVMSKHAGVEIAKENIEPKSRIQPFQCNTGPPTDIGLLTETGPPITDVIPSDHGPPMTYSLDLQRQYLQASLAPQTSQTGQPTVLGISPPVPTVSQSLQAGPGVRAPYKRTSSGSLVQYGSVSSAQTFTGADSRTRPQTVTQAATVTASQSSQLKRMRTPTPPSIAHARGRLTMSGEAGGSAFPPSPRLGRSATSPILLVQRRHGSSTSLTSLDTTSYDFSDTSSTASSPFTPDMTSRAARFFSGSEVSDSPAKEKLKQKLQQKRRSLSKGSTDEEAAELERATRSEGLSEEELRKKERRREQNRMAAQRCRQKKNEQSHHLTKDYQKLQSSNTQLNFEIRTLRKEKEKLEMALSEHTKHCDIPSIRDSSQASGSNATISHTTRTTSGSQSVLPTTCVSHTSSQSLSSLVRAPFGSHVLTSQETCPSTSAHAQLTTVQPEQAQWAVPGHSSSVSAMEVPESDTESETDFDMAGFDFNQGS